MTPLDFVKFDGSSSPNTPVYKIAEALDKNLIIRTRKGEMVVLSYYYDDARSALVIDIERKKD